MSYTRVNWKDYPDTTTPVNAENLNKMDEQISENTADIESLDSTKANAADLATVATSGSYSDLSDQPTIPTNNNQLTNGAGYITSSGTAANVSGTVAVDHGGTGATTAANARTNLGLGAAATCGTTTSATSGSSALITSGAVYSLTALSSYNSSGIYAYKYGRIVYLIFNNIKDSTVCSFSIPSAYRPIKDIWPLGYITDVATSSVSYDAALAITTSGTIKVYYKSSDNKWNAHSSTDFGFTGVVSYISAS